VIRAYVFVEGQTEEEFVRALLYDHFLRLSVCLQPILIRTSRSGGRGGIARYEAVKPQLVRKCREEQSAYVTTMFDLYALPKSFPGQNTIPVDSNPFQKVSYLETQFQNDINEANFIPNLLVHEFEGLLFSDPRKFGTWFPSSAIDKLSKIAADFASPEEINDGQTTAPSKRILKVCPGYNKPLHGTLITMEIGIETIRKKCCHFHEWLLRLERLNGKETS